MHSITNIYGDQADGMTRRLVVIAPIVREGYNDYVTKQDYMTKT